jgi:hypothetical protein
VEYQAEYNAIDPIESECNAKLHDAHNAKRKATQIGMQYQAICASVQT